MRPTKILALEEISLEERQRLIMTLAAIEGIEKETDPAECNAMLSDLYSTVGPAWIAQQSDTLGNLEILKEKYGEAFEEAEDAYNILKIFASNNLADNPIVYKKARIVAERLMHLKAVAFSPDFETLGWTKDASTDKNLINEMQNLIIENGIWSLLTTQKTWITNHKTINTKDFKPNPKLESSPRSTEESKEEMESENENKDKEEEDAPKETNGEANSETNNEPNFSAMRSAAIQGIQKEVDPAERNAMLYAFHSMKIPEQNDDEKTRSYLNEQFKKTYKETSNFLKSAKAATKNVSLYEGARPIAERLMHLAAVAFSPEFKTSKHESKCNEIRNKMQEMQTFIQKDRIWNLLNNPETIDFSDDQIDTGFRPAPELMNNFEDLITNPAEKCSFYINGKKAPTSTDLVAAHELLIEIVSTGGLNVDSDKLTTEEKSTIKSICNYIAIHCEYSNNSESSNSHKSIFKAIESSPRQQRYFLNKDDLSRLLDEIIENQIPKLKKHQEEVLKEIAVNYLRAEYSYRYLVEQPLSEDKTELEKNLEYIKAILNQSSALKTLQDMEEGTKKGQLPPNSLNNIFYLETSEENNKRAESIIEKYALSTEEEEEYLSASENGDSNGNTAAKSEAIIREKEEEEEEVVVADEEEKEATDTNSLSSLIKTLNRKPKKPTKQFGYGLFGRGKKTYNAELKNYSKQLKIYYDELDYDNLTKLIKSLASISNASKDQALKLINKEFKSTYKRAATVMRAVSDAQKKTPKLTAPLDDAKNIADPLEFLLAVVENNLPVAQGKVSKENHTPSKNDSDPTYAERIKLIHALLRLNFTNMYTTLLNTEDYNKDSVALSMDLEEAKEIAPDYTGNIVEMVPSIPSTLNNS